MCRGLGMVIDPEMALNIVDVGLVDLIRTMHPNDFQWTGRTARDPNMLTIERHGGTAKLKQAIEAGTLSDLLKQWDADAERFRAIRAPYLLYEYDGSRL